MDIEEEVFEDFFSKLKSDGISSRVIEKLKKLRETNEINIVEKIKEIFLQEGMNAENKDH